jgi:signal transduction histidine kinase
MPPDMFSLIAVLVIAFCNLTLGLIVLLKNRRNFTNITFGIFALSLAVWLPITFYSNDPFLTHNLSLQLTRTAIFIPNIALYFLVLFSMSFTGYLRRYFRVIALLLGLLVLVVSFISITSILIGGLTPEPSKHLVILKYGPFAPVFTFFIVGQVLTVVTVLLSSVRQLKGSAKARVQYMAISLFLTLSILVITNLILPLVFHVYSYATTGLYSSFIVVGGYTYAIVKHRLFDIRAVVARSVAYLLLLATLGGGYALITFKIGGLLFASTSLSTTQQSFNVVTALVLVLTFQPLKRLFEKLTDKIFYRDHYEPDTLIKKISQVLASEIDLVNLSHRVRTILMREMRLESVNIVVLNNNKLFAEAGHYVVSRLEDLARDLGNLRGQLIVAEEELDGKRKIIMQQYAISVMVVLRTKEDKRIGYLLFGEKLNGDVFTETDLKVIRIISDQLAVAIQNAKAYVQIQRFNRTLQTKISDATKQLREANDSLQELDSVKDEFISVASHQLRTPLTIIDGYLSNILDGVYGSFNDKQKKAIELTQNRLRLTAALVTDLLNLSRMAAGRFFIDPVPVDLDKLVEEEISQLKIKAGIQHVTIAYSGPEKALPLIAIDESKTRQAVMNLIDNAIVYGSIGKTIDVSLKVVGNQMDFEVKDHGIGVPKDAQTKLFNKFFRAENAKKRRADGTGIGLYLVKRVIEEQGGEIIFSSKEGEGSIFGFRLPIIPISKSIISKAPTDDRVLIHMGKT